MICSQSIHNFVVYWQKRDRRTLVWKSSPPASTAACATSCVCRRRSIRQAASSSTAEFTTDLAIIRNCDADAVFAVYPFTPQQAISDAIIKYSYVPVFCGVGGGTTRGLRTVQLARDVESQGAMGVVLNAPINNLNLRAVSGVIDIPTVITVTKFGTDFEARIEAGASILNIAAAAQTPELVREARKALPDVPIIATGGKTGESILRTIEAGANAITYTPPSTYELFQEMMKGYRE